VFEADEISWLSVAREGNEHEYGWVVGLAGFHEFIAIDRERSIDRHHRNRRLTQRNCGT
jgi:hypothetical protein